MSARDSNLALRASRDSLRFYFRPLLPGRALQEAQASFLSLDFFRFIEAMFWGGIF